MCVCVCVCVQVVEEGDGNEKSLPLVCITAINSLEDDEEEEEILNDVILMTVKYEFHI